MSSESILLNPVIQFVIIFGSSLLASLLLYGLLKSTGMFKRKGMQLGGAAAGFIIIFIVASQIFERINDQYYKGKISELEEEILDLKKAEKPEIECPDGFDEEISHSNGIAYAYPKNWDSIKVGIIAIYKRPESEGTEKPEIFRPNIVIMVEALNTDIRDKIEEGEITEVDRLESMAAEAVKNLKGYNDETSVYIVNKHEGLKTTFECEDKGIELSVEQIAVIDLSENRIFAFTLAALPGQIGENRKTFYSIIDSVKFLD